MAKREKNTVNKHKEKSSRGENHTVEEREDLIAGRNAVTEASHVAKNYDCYTNWYDFGSCDWCSH